MTLEEAMAILLYYRHNAPWSSHDKMVEIAANTVVAEHAKQAITRFTSEGDKRDRD